MVKRPTRRRVLTLSGAGLAAGLAGCLGGSDDESTGDDNGSGGLTGDDESNGTASTGGDGDGLTIRHNIQTGRYEFEGGSTDVEGEYWDTFVWDVQSLDGYDASVEASFGRNNPETMTLTASPDAPEPTLTEPYYIGEDYDISDLLSTRMVELWFPNHLLGHIDVETLSVGAEPDGTAGLSYEVVRTEQYAGIDCYVLEEWLFDEYHGNYCVSPEHAMVIAGENYSNFREEVEYRFELVSYED